MTVRAVAHRLTRLHKSPAWLAEQLQVEQLWVSRRMTGQVTIDLDDVDRLAAALGLSSGFELLSLDLAEAEDPDEIEHTTP